MPDIAAVQSLVHRHHLVENVTNDALGVTQFIAVDPDSLQVSAVSDPRKDGRPAAQTSLAVAS